MMHTHNRIDSGFMDQWLSTLVIVLAAMAPVWWLCQQLGHSGWLSLLMLVPLLNMVFLAYRPERFSHWWRVDYGRKPAAQNDTGVIASARDRRRRLPSAALAKRPAAYCSRANRRSFFHTVV